MRSCTLEGPWLHWAVFSTDHICTWVLCGCSQLGAVSTMKNFYYQTLKLNLRVLHTRGSLYKWFYRSVVRRRSKDATSWCSSSIQPKEKYKDRSHVLDHLLMTSRQCLSVVSSCFWHSWGMFYLADARDQHVPILLFIKEEFKIWNSGRIRTCCFSDHKV